MDIAFTISLLLIGKIVALAFYADYVQANPKTQKHTGRWAKYRTVNQ